MGPKSSFPIKSPFRAAVGNFSGVYSGWATAFKWMNGGHVRHYMYRVCLWGSGGWILIILSYYFTNWLLMGAGGWADHRACWVSEAPASIYWSILVQLHKKMPLVRKKKQWWNKSSVQLLPHSAAQPVSNLSSFLPLLLLASLTLLHQKPHGRSIACSLSLSLRLSASWRLCFKTYYSTHLFTCAIQISSFQRFYLFVFRSMFLTTITTFCRFSLDITVSQSSFALHRPSRFNKDLFSWLIKSRGKNVRVRIKILQIKKKNLQLKGLEGQL